MYVDYRQAYDSIHRPALWNILRYFKIPEKLIRVIRSLYNNSRGRVKVAGELTEVFGVETGLRQGCPLSCVLFNLTLEWILRHTPPSQDAVCMTNGVSCDRLGYADDLDLMGETYRGRDTQMARFNQAGQKAGLQVSEEKTKVMKASREDREEDFIVLDDFVLEMVDQFRYLGSTVTADNDMVTEINIRISSASKCTWGLNSILRSKSLSHTTKLCVYKTIIRPVLSYACETWTTTKDTMMRLEVFERSVLRRIYGPVRDAESGEWRIRHNYELLQMSQLPPISSFVRAQRLRWAGHVARMADGSLLRLLLEGTPEGRRPLGRPRLRWEDCVKHDLALLGVDDPAGWMALAQDRQRWRQLVHTAKGHMGPAPMEYVRVSKSIRKGFIGGLIGISFTH